MKNTKRFGTFGGSYVSELLVPVLARLEKEFASALKDKKFAEQVAYYGSEFAGRETPLYFAQNLSKKFGVKIYLKREDLLHTGAHKINNTIGQALLAKRMEKTRLIAETGAGQHGVATATAAALLGLECVVYMGEEDAKRQALNVYRMRLLGTEVRIVSAGSKTLKDAINEALRDYATNSDTTHYIIGSAMGPHPYPSIVRHFQSVIGKEAKAQILKAEGKLPAYLLACVGGGSNSIGLLQRFWMMQNARRSKWPGLRPAAKAWSQECTRLASAAMEGQGFCTALSPMFWKMRTGRLGTPTPSPPGLTTLLLGRSTRCCTRAAG